jgi:AraC-like DNA-binding protein
MDDAQVLRGRPITWRVEIIVFNHTPRWTAIAFISEHYHEPVSIREMAQTCGLSLGSFHRQFRDTFLCTPHTYLRQLRVRMSCHALVFSRRPIAAVAAESAHGAAGDTWPAAAHAAAPTSRPGRGPPTARRERPPTSPVSGAESVHLAGVTAAREAKGKP